MSKTSKPTKGALKNRMLKSISGEDQAIADRFAKADEIFLSSETSSSEKQPNSNFQNAKSTESPKSQHQHNLSGADKRQNELIRDGFSIPRHEYIVVEQIRKKLAQEGIIISKSEVIRIALTKASQLSVSELKDIHSELDVLTPGRKPRRKTSNS